LEEIEDVDLRTNPTALKLMRAFMQFERAAWHQRTVAGYRPSEIRLLMCIKRLRSLSPADLSELKVSELSKHLHVTAPTTTQLIKSLEANGLVERQIDHSDRRVVYTRLTEKGEAVAQQAMEDLSATFSGLIDYLGEERSNAFADLLVQVFNYFHQKEKCEAYHEPGNGDENL
jgi:DNA-binding MarR family transcriptional regulator